MLTKVEVSELARSVLAVPPIAMTPDLQFSAAANAALIRHIEAGGVSTLLYGGNANVQNWPVSRFAAWLEQLGDMAGEKSWLIPSVGPDWGKLMDQAAILKHMRLPVAMALPMTGPQTPDGIARGLQDFVSASGLPLIVYIKSDNYIAADALGKLVQQGTVFGVKYAVPRVAIESDAYLEAIIEAVGPERVVSGFGEPPAVPHLKRFGLAGFTAGCVCLAPTLSMQLLRALQQKDWAKAENRLPHFAALENLRDRGNNIRVLHTAVTLSGLADMGPILPLLTGADPALHGEIREAARALLATEQQARAGRKAA